MAVLHRSQHARALWCCRDRNFEELIGLVFDDAALLAFNYN